MARQDIPADEDLRDTTLSQIEELADFNYLENADRTELSSAKVWWFFGQWEKLTKIDITSKVSHPDYNKLALLKACAFQQTDDVNNTEKWLRVALTSGCDYQLVSKFMLCGLEHKIAKLHLLNGNSEQAKVHMQNALDINWKGIDIEFGVEVRLTRELTNQGLLDDSAAILTEQVKSLEQQELTSKTEAKLGVVKSELELINHQLMLALQKNQLYQTSRKKNKKKTKSKKIDIERLAELSTSQLGQDLWVLNETKYKRKGFFVEFGATDGVLLSNTYLLEREFGWEGICAEPNPDYFESLKKNRNCIVNNECIYSSTGKIIRFVLANEFGGIEKDALKGRHKEKVEAYKSNGDTIDVETISLNDVLIKYNAPINIDYMSIDTEGSELEILSKFDFKKWNVKLFTIEHNFEPQRDGIFKLLSKHGYQRIECKWDDFYIREIKRK